MIAPSAASDPSGSPAPATIEPVGELLRETLAIILAGGRGSRLGRLTEWRAKPAVPFGGKFRIIDFPLSNCINSGIRRIGICTQYKAQSLIRHVLLGWSFLDGRFGEFIELLPAQQRITADWYKGTADAVYQNLDVFRIYRPKLVLILAGDHVYKMDYGRMLAQHHASGADMTIACIDVPLADAPMFGIMSVDQSMRITAFQEKPAQPAPAPGKPGLALASMGIYVFNAPLLYEQVIRDSGDPKSSHDFGKDIIPHLLARGYRVYAHRFEDSCVGSGEGRAYWRDVGTIDAFWEANMELTKIVPDLDMYDQKWPIWTHQVQLPPAKFVFDDDGRRGIAVDSMVSGGCIVSGATVRRSLLFSNVHVHSYATVEDSVILPDVDIGRHAILRRTIVEKGCRIPEGLVAGVDPEADRKRFHVTERGVTVIVPEMLDQQMHEMR